MVFVSKRKAQLTESISHARQAKRPRLGGIDGYEGALGVSETTNEREPELTSNVPYTTPPLSQSNRLLSPNRRTSCNNPMRKPRDRPLTSLQIVFAPHSAHPTNSTIDRAYCTQKRRAKTVPVPLALSDERELPAPETEADTPHAPAVNQSAEPESSFQSPLKRRHICKPPPRAGATLALQTLNKLLHPPRNKGPGYKKCKLDGVTRTRYEQMAACLCYFLKTAVTFTDALEQAAIGAGKGVWRAQRIRAWVQHLIRTGDLPRHRHGLSSRSLLKHEDIDDEITLFLQTKGKHFVANDIVQFLNDPATQQRLTIRKTISDRTAQRWLHSKKYRWRKEQPGQYFDGHEREDVVHYRREKYVPKMKGFEPRMMSWDYETFAEKPSKLQVDQREVVIWFHDTSTFYAHDRRTLGWHRKGARSALAKKGQGASVMISNFVSARYGWLASRNRKSNARKILHAGKNREGYMTNVDICEQFKRAVQLVKREYPEQDHVFVYDNARIHTKRPAAAATARGMTKNESGFGVRIIDANNKQVKVKMENPLFPDGTEQQLYHPNGKFKGMVTFLQERGYNTSGLRAECAQFKCKDQTANCCCRRILFNLIDIKSEQKAILQSLAESLGTEVVFLPKFHCELNPIEQCWGYAKRLYRVAPPSSLTADVEKNMLRSLDKVPIKSIRRFAARSQRFLEAYANGLDGPNAASSVWVKKRFQGHRVTPEQISV